LIHIYRYFVIAIFLFTGTNLLFSQGNFKLINGVKKKTITFKLHSNLIVFPIEVNGKELNFILDSGVGSTILFNPDTRDSLQLNNIEKIKLQGLGSEEPVDALLSKNNSFKNGAIEGTDQFLYVVFDDRFDLSSKLGMTIHGIIGYEILKNFVIKINYSSKRLTFYDPEHYDYDKCRKCETFNLEFYKFKPYITVGAKLDENSEKITPVKLLIDSGGSDAMWLFENSREEIKPPTNYFRDFLGEGLSGIIHGKRSKIKSLVIGSFELKNPTVSYPDSVSVAYALKFTERNGSMGGTVLKRFHVIFDYPHSKITLKKSSNFKQPFRYNMSGIELAYNGKVLVQENDNTTFSLAGKTHNSEANTVTLSYRYKYAFKPSYRIHNVREGSPAAEAGLMKDDLLIKINGKYTHNMKLDEIMGYFYLKENKKITMVVERMGRDYYYEFRLRNML
jgi:hypothetical protein